MSVLWLLACHHVTVPAVPDSLSADIQRTPLPSGSGYPNGITLAPDGTLYVGFVDHGRISARHPVEGVRELDVGGTELFAATSLRFDPRTNLLWVTSPDFPNARQPHRVGTLDVDRGEVVWSAPLPNDGFGNDLVLDGRGGAYLTDSSRDVVLHVTRDGTFTDHARLPPAEGALGAAGITRLSNGELVVGRFSRGDLFRVTPDGTAANVPLQAPIHNPDGMLLHGSDVLVVEGAVESGNGRLVRVDTKTGRVEPLADGLDSPLNLTATSTGVLLTESGIRHLMTDGVAPPEHTYLTEITLWDAPPPLPSVVLPDGMYPESLTFDRAGLGYVGSATTHGIQRVVDGVAEPFVAAGTQGLLSVQGLLTTATTLYACTADLGVHGPSKGPSALLAFELSTGAPSGSWPLPTDGFCNDLTSLPDGSLLLSDSTAPRIWRFDPSQETLAPWLVHPLLGGAALNGNGIAWSSFDDAVYLSTFGDGRLLHIPVHNGVPGVPAVIDLSRPLDGADAVRVVGPKRVVVFENGLGSGSGGRVTSVVVDGLRGRMARLWSSEDQPTSGWVGTDGTLSVVESQFAHLFGGDKGQEPSTFVIRQLQEPVADLWALPSR